MDLSSIGDKYCPSICRPFWERAKNSAIARRMASGAFWSVAGSVIGKGCSLLAMILLMRILASDLYGKFEAVRSTANMFIVFASFGMGATSTKYIAEYLVTDKDRAGRIIGLNYLFTIIVGLAFSVLYYFSCPFLCEHLLKKPNLVFEMRFGAVLLFLVSFMGAQNGVLSGFQNFRGLAFTEAAVGVARIPLMVAGAWFYGLYGALIAFAISLVLNIVLNALVIFRSTRQHGIRYSFRDAYRESSVVWKFSLPSMLAGMISIPVFWFCGMLLMRQENGASEYGVFMAVQQICALLMFVPSMMVQITIPMLSEADAMRDKSKFRRIALYNLIVNVATTAVVALPMMLFASWIMGLCGPDFVNGANILIVYCLVTLLMGPDWIVSQILTSRGKMWTVFGLNVFWSLMLMLVSIVLLRNGWGGIALAVAVVCAYAVRLLLAIPVLSRSRIS